jgi:hypothetical protein
MSRHHPPSLLHEAEPSRCDLGRREVKTRSLPGEEPFPLAAHHLRICPEGHFRASSLSPNAAGLMRAPKVLIRQQTVMCSAEESQVLECRRAPERMRVLMMDL